MGGKGAAWGGRGVSVMVGRAAEEGEGSVSCEGEGSGSGSGDEGYGDEEGSEDEEAEEAGASSGLCSGPVSDCGGCSGCSGGGGVGVVNEASLRALDSGLGLLVLSSGVGRGGDDGGGCRGGGGEVEKRRAPGPVRRLAVMLQRRHIDG
jgi:hypothetical protein